MAKKKKHWSVLLKHLEACRGAQKWARRTKSLREAWRTCERGGWMDWFCQMLSTESDIFMWRSSRKAWRFWDSFANAAKHDIDHLDAAEAELIRKHWPEPPKIPKKLLKQAGLV